ncbi:MAG: T9SS type A sorting domain-containing protein [Bacteroidia bacterium]|nr:T9SS type A sorting domain-containing protein [Bacteroidia bacterium]
MKLFKLILIVLFAFNIASAQRLLINTNVNKSRNFQSSILTGKVVQINKVTKSELQQIPDDINGRLYRLCKIWGYFKYFHQNKCTLKWDTLLNTTINQVLNSTSNLDFNNSLMVMFNKVGNNTNLPNSSILPDTNLNFNNSWITDTVLSQSVRNFLDTFTLYIHPDTSTCFIKYNDYSNSNNFGLIDFSNDSMILLGSSQNKANRLAIMFYYWNVINYFHPFKNIMDQSWDSTLYEFIPKIRQVSLTADFHKTFLKLVTKINDSHGFTSSNILENTFWGGSYMPPIYFTRIDTNCVVTKLQNIPGVHIGDILTSIKGIGIKNIEDSLSDFVPSSTPAAFYRDAYSQMLRGTESSGVLCTFLDSTNNLYSVTIARSMFISYWYNWIYNNGNSTSYFFTNCGYGYVDMGKLQSSEVNGMYTTFQNAPAIIFDIRNYPNGTLWDLAPLLFPSPTLSAKFFEPSLTNLPNKYYMPGWYNVFDDGSNIGNWSNLNPYNGDIYLLVNQETQSQAEYTCQYLSYFPNSKVIGTQTAGADGNISIVTLPGGIITYFTSLGWYYEDGYQQQRNGVKIDSIVTPTRIGLSHGKDEILEAVFHCPTEINYSNISENKVSAYPNPVTNELTIEIKENNDKLNYEILNLMGQTVIKGIFTEKTIVRTTDLKAGVYLLKINNGKNIEYKKIVKE